MSILRFQWNHCYTQSGLFVKPPHTTFMFSSPSRSFEIKISKYQVLSELLPNSCQKYWKGKNVKYFNALLWKKSNLYKNRERNKISAHVPNTQLQKLT